MSHGSTPRQPARPGGAWQTILSCLVPCAAILGGCATPSNAFVHSPLSRCEEVSGQTGRVRVATFNIRAGLSSDLETIAETLAALDADVIALQEVDVGVARTGRVDQARTLAERLGYDFVFAGAMKREGGDYGVALLSRLPIEAARRIPLVAGGAFEPRVAIDATVCAGSERLRVVAVHVDFLPWAAAANARTLAEALDSEPGEPTVVAGDLNMGPGEEAPSIFTRRGFVDVVGRFDEGPTFEGGQRLDYVLVDPSLASDAGPAMREESTASDHFPVIADLSLPGTNASR